MTITTSATREGIPSQRMSFYDESSCRHANVGRPQDEIKHESFLKVIRYSDDHDTVGISVIDLNTKMAES